VPFVGFGRTSSASLIAVNRKLEGIYSSDRSTTQGM
jgi:hypothetical protein